MSLRPLLHSHNVRRLVRAAAWLAAASCAPAFAGLDVNPVFPSFGEKVSIALTSVGPAPWIPATRYRRDGRTLVLEMENMPGGFFGPRADMQYMPVAVGELPPGSYALQARLYDLGDPTAPARLFSQTLEVAPPDAAGVYTVPRMPGAYESIEYVVRAESPIDAASVRGRLDGSAIRIDFQFSNDPNAPTFATVKLPGLAPNAYRVDAYGGYPNMPGVPPRQYSGNFYVGTATTVVEYFADQQDHYFITAEPGEIAKLDAGYEYKRTGQSFKAWLRQADAPAYAAPVCHFHASGPDSHFYSLNPAECEMLKSLELADKAARPKDLSYPGWQFQGTAFYALAPENGKCSPGSTPVYRFYNGRWAENDSNHRFTAAGSMQLAMSMSWSDEGVAFCSPE